MFADVAPDARIFQEEIFGPVVAITPFDTDEEALELANGVKYGLAAYIWTNDLSARTTSRRPSRPAWCGSTRNNVRDLRTPFGGVKASGLGHEGGYRSIDFYTDQQAVHITLGEVHTPTLRHAAARPTDRLRRRASVDRQEPTDPTRTTNRPHAGATPPDIVRCAYMELVVTDLAASRAFYVDVLGLIVTEEDESTIYLRSLEEFIHHNLVLRKGPVAAVAALAYRVRTPEDLDARRGVLQGARMPRRAPRRTASSKGIGDSVRVEDPLGFPYEFFYDVEHVERLAWRYDLYTPGALVRLDHFNQVTPTCPAAVKYMEDLGFRVTEDIQDEAGTLRRLDAPQAHRARHRHDRRRRPAHAPRRVRDAREAQHHRDLRQARRAADVGRDRARPRPPRRLERVLPVPARPRRPPHRDLHAGLLHRRPRQPRRHLGRARQPAPRLVGQPGRAVLVHRGLASCSTWTATRSRSSRDRRLRDGGHDRRRRLLLHPQAAKNAASSSAPSCNKAVARPAAGCGTQPHPAVVHLNALVAVRSGEPSRHSFGSSMRYRHLRGTGYFDHPTPVVFDRNTQRYQDDGGDGTEPRGDGRLPISMGHVAKAMAVIIAIPTEVPIRCPVCCTPPALPA